MVMKVERLEIVDIRSSERRKRGRGKKKRRPSSLLTNVLLSGVLALSLRHDVSRSINDVLDGVVLNSDEENRSHDDETTG